MEMIHVLVADDHTLFRKGIYALLKSISDMQVVGDATTGEEAIERAAALQPDVILMDIQMLAPNNAPAINGIEATRRISRTSPHIGILMLTMFKDDDSVFAAMRAGARGCILKGAEQEELLRAIRAVANGEALFSPEIAGRLMNYFKQNQAPILPELSERERQVLNLIAQGFNNTEIAQQLMIAPKTVRNHINNIFSKLQVADRAQAIIKAREAGLG